MCCCLDSLQLLRRRVEAFEASIGVVDPLYETVVCSMMVVEVFDWGFDFVLQDRELSGWTLRFPDSRLARSCR